jgi:hypothetical protein
MMECYVKRELSEKKFPKVMSDEISLTVEETNELRKKLGLRPLDTVNKSKTDVPMPVDVQTKKKDKTHDRDTDEGKRLLQELSGGGGILDDIVGSVSESDQSAKRLRLGASDSGSSDSDNPNSTDRSDSE